MDIRTAIDEGSLSLSSLFLEQRNKLARSEARLLLQKALSLCISDISIEYILSNPTFDLTTDVEIAYFKLIERRSQCEPIAYLLESKEFYSLDFIVSPATLIPRPETELIVDAVIQDYYSQLSARFLDLGTGSGCLAISIVMNITQATATAVDISLDALEIAKANAIRHNVVDKIEFVHSNWCKSVTHQLFDFIVCNPPYIMPSTRESNVLALETRIYEPSLALYAGNEGLEYYQTISEEAKNYLKPQGKIYLEIGYNQYLQVKEVFINNGWNIVGTIEDLAGYKRCLIFQI